MVKVNLIVPNHCMQCDSITGQGNMGSQIIYFVNAEIYVLREDIKPKLSSCRRQSAEVHCEYV